MEKMKIFDMFSNNQHKGPMLTTQTGAMLTWIHSHLWLLGNFNISVVRCNLNLESGQRRKHYVKIANQDFLSFWKWNFNYIVTVLVHFFKKAERNGQIAKDGFLKRSSDNRAVLLPVSHTYMVDGKAHIQLLEQRVEPLVTNTEGHRREGDGSGQVPASLSTKPSVGSLQMRHQRATSHVSVILQTPSLRHVKCDASKGVVITSSGTARVLFDFNFQNSCSFIKNLARQ